MKELTERLNRLILVVYVWLNLKILVPLTRGSTVVKFKNESKSDSRLNQNRERYEIFGFCLVQFCQKRGQMKDIGRIYVTPDSFSVTLNTF